MWTSNELSSAGDGHVCNLLSLISCLEMSRWQMRNVFSLIITSGDMEECQVLSFISIWADSIRQMLYYGISSNLLGLQSFPESWEHEVIKNNYQIQHRSYKQEGMGLRRRTVVCVCVHLRTCGTQSVTLMNLCADRSGDARWQIINNHLCRCVSVLHSSQPSTDTQQPTTAAPLMPPH